MSKDTKKIRLELTEDEFNMIIDKLNWMRCVVRDSNLPGRDYCNGLCGHECDRPELCDFGNWFRSKIISEVSEDEHKRT